MLDARAQAASLYSALAATIVEKAAGRTIVYVPNPGNFGDGLIRYATKMFFKHYGIDHIELNIAFRGGRYLLIPLLLRRKYFLVYGGGGAWCGNFCFGRDICRMISRFTNQFLVLPTTYDSDITGISGTLMRRDNYVSKTVAPHSSFCHDMALYLAVQDTRSFQGTPNDAEPCYALRTDRESALTKGDLPDGNLDFSEMGNHMSNGDEFIELVSRYKTIVTDRLHVAIAGGLAQATVELRSGNNSKIEGVYKSSLRDMFPHIAFANPLSEPSGS